MKSDRSREETGSQLGPSSYLFIGAAVVAVLFALDVVAMFALTSYLLSYAIAATYVLLGLFGLFGPVKKLFVIVPACAIVVFTVLLPGIRTSGRKGFWLDAQSIKVGMSASEASTLMEGYSVFDKYRATGHLTYSFRSGRHTEDHVLITLSDDGKTVVGVEYSAD